MTTDSEPTATDECYRCGYDLRGITSDRPCPECGLLAERSRRITDELHHTRPRWLRRLSLGLWLILLGVGISILWQGIWPMLLFRVAWWQFLPWLGLGLGAMIFWIGAMLLTAREGYPLADQADAKLRWTVRAAAFTPLLASVLHQIQLFIDFLQAPGAFASPYYSSPDQWRPLEIASLSMLLIGGIFLPYLIFLHLRGLAKRARSAHLAEHCLIVGIGASLSILYIAAAVFVLSNGDEWFNRYWSARSNVPIVLMLFIGVSAFLFILWSLYLAIRFAIAFSLARRQLVRNWKRDDRSLSPL